MMMRLLLALVLFATALPALAQSTIDPAKKFSYGANIGWINWKPDQPAPSGGAVTGEAVLAGKIYSANCGWIDLGDGTPANGVAYQNNSATDFGVNVTAGGALVGFAYGANIGWINFEQTFGQPKINLLTGGFSGFAYGANVGWINLGTGDLGTLTIQCTDVDGDGIGDEFEQQNFGNLTTANATTDFDRDGASDFQEYAALTDPKSGISFPDIFSISPSPSLSASVRIIFTSSPGRTYAVQSSPSLQLGSWLDIPGFENFLPDAGSSTTRDLPASQTPPRHFRVVARKPLQP
jgi:hypothetical protein